MTNLKGSNLKSTKKAMLCCMVSMLVCFAMLVGSTFAWFSDSVTSTNNKIVAGNLDVELYKVEGETETKVTSETNLFMENALWEPGHVEVVNLKIVNAGSLALKYQFGINIANEVIGTNVNNQELQLSKYIKFAVIEGNKIYTTREEAMEDAQTNGSFTLSEVAINQKGELYPEGTEGKATTSYVTVVVYMPTEVENEANYKSGTTAPEIHLGVTLVATQLSYEEDSFGNDYDRSGVSIQGIVGYEERIFDSVQEAYHEISPFVAALAGLEQDAITKGNAEENKKAFDSVYSNNGKIVWTIYGEQTIDNPYLFSFGRKASHYNDGLDITNIDIVGGNASAKLIMNTGVVLPYNWWSETTPTIATTIQNITLEKGTVDRISFEPAWGYKFNLQFKNCNINGSIHYLYDNDCELTFDGCHFKNIEGNTYAYALFVQGSSTASSIVTFKNNIVEGYDRGINLQRANTEFVIINNTFKNSTKTEKGVVQITEGKKFTVNGNTFEEGVVGYAILYHELLKNAEITVENNIVNSTKYWFNETTADANITVNYLNNTGTAITE